MPGSGMLGTLPPRMQPDAALGTWHRLGAGGLVYEVIGPAAALPDGPRRRRIRVVESGEELDVRLAEILDDPRAA